MSYHHQNSLLKIKYTSKNSFVLLAPLLQKHYPGATTVAPNHMYSTHAHILKQKCSFHFSPHKALSRRCSRVLVFWYSQFSKGITVVRSAAENFGRSRSRSRSCGRSAVAAAPQPQVCSKIHKVKKNWKNKLKYIFKLEY